MQVDQEVGHKAAQVAARAAEMAATELEAGLATMVEVARHTTAVVHPARRALMPYRDMADTAAMDTELAGAALCAQRTTGALALRAVAQAAGLLDHKLDKASSPMWWLVATAMLAICKSNIRTGNRRTS